MEELRQAHIEKLRSLSNEERLQKIDGLRKKYERDKERLRRAKELRGTK